MSPKVVVTGSLAFDHIMSMPGKFSDHILPDKLHILNVSFIMNTFRQEYGGTAGNIAWGLGLLKTKAVIVAAAGSDFTEYRMHLGRLGQHVDASGVRQYKNDLSARGFVTTDSQDNQIWGFYEGAMKKSSRLSLKKYLSKGCVLMIAPNDPAAMQSYVDQAIDNKISYVFDPAFNIPHLTKTTLKKAIKNSTILIGNDYEIELIKRRLGWSKDQLISLSNIVITTLGGSGVKIDTRKQKIKIAAAKPENESDPTGAGDAFRAGFLAGYIRGYPLETCGKMGAVSAVYTVEKYGTQTHKFTVKEFAKRYRKNYSEDLPPEF